MSDDRDKLLPGRLKLRDLLNGRYISRKPIYDFLVEKEKYLTGNLLDFGCGSMQYSNVFLHCDNYVGLDIESARENGFVPLKGKEIVYYDGKHIPFADGVFDSVVSVEVLEHVEDLLQILLEVNRIIKMGGILS